MKKEEYCKKNVLRFALFMGELMLSNGAETNRVEDTIKRICFSRGFKYVNVFISPTSLIISDDRFDGITFMKNVKERSINLNKIMLLNDFSRRYVADKSISAVDAIEELKRINETAYTYPDYVYYIATGIGCAGFAFIIGGNNILNFMLTIVTSIIATISYKYVMKFSSIPAFSSLIASIVIAVIATSLTSLGLISSPSTMIVGSIMPLLAGVIFIKGIRDLITGDLISGVARIAEACLTTVSVATGVGFVLDIWMKLGGIL